MQLDTEGKRRAAIFKEWQVPLLDHLFGRDLTSTEAHKFLMYQDIRVKGSKGRAPVSRGSVILFLNKLVEEEFLTYTEFTGRGGWGKRYSMTLTREQFAHKITGKFVSKLLEAFPKESLTFMWPRP